MKLPAAELAVVSRDKVAEYLLNAAHPDNGGKAPFFQALGFTQDDWPILATALLELAQTGESAHRTDSPHGAKYILDGRIDTPSGKMAVIRTIWIVDRGTATPRLITAYPHEE